METNEIRAEGQRLMDTSVQILSFNMRNPQVLAGPRPKYSRH